MGQVCYRVVQEALTNAIRHAPGSTATVLLDGHDGCRLSVIDDGGQLTAAPEGVGWAVRAKIPAADLPAQAAPRQPASAEEVR